MRAGLRSKCGRRWLIGGAPDVVRARDPQMSIGIHSGTFDFFLVGSLHRELVITGPAASMTVAMETVAEATEVAVSPSTAAALDPRWLGTSKPPGILAPQSA